MQKVLLISYFISLGYSAFIGFINRHRHQKPVNVIWIYQALTLVMDLYCEFLHFSGQKFQYIYILYAPVEYGFIASIYYSFINSKPARRIILFSVPVYTLTCVVSYLVFKFNTHYHIFNLRGCLIIVMVLFYFRELYKQDTIVEVKNEPLFWISVGNLIFWSGNFFIVGLVTPLYLINTDIGELIYSLNPMLNIFLYYMYSKAFLCNKKVIPSSL